MKLRFLRLSLWFAGLFILGALMVVLLAWKFPQELLTVDSGDVKADAIVVMGGGTDERPTRAAELYLAGAAPLILVSGYGDCARNSQILRLDGVPAAALLEEDRSLSTLENARLSVAILREKGVRKAIIVTSWYHSRRALACFRRAAPDIEFYSRPAYRTYPRTEWNRHGTSQYIRNEYLKTLGYWVCYGIPPW